MLVRAARTNKISLSQFSKLLRTKAAIFAMFDGPASFTQKTIQNVQVKVDQVVAYIRSLELNDYQKNVNRCRSPGGNSGRGDERKYIRRT